jgi:hypothetical protein
MRNRFLGLRRYNSQYRISKNLTHFHYAAVVIESGKFSTLINVEVNNTGATFTSPSTTSPHYWVLSPFVIPLQGIKASWIMRSLCIYVSLFKASLCVKWPRVCRCPLFQEDLDTSNPPCFPRICYLIHRDHLNIGTSWSREQLLEYL